MEKLGNIPVQYREAIRLFIEDAGWDATRYIPDWFVYMATRMVSCGWHKGKPHPLNCNFSSMDMSNQDE